MQSQSEKLAAEIRAASSEEASLRGRRDGLTSQLDGLAANRREATEQLGKLTKRQLAEIKQLTRSPPDSIRRTFAAAWLLLHGDRFLGKPTVTFDEAKDWPRCQKMLADEGFISHITRFDMSSLLAVPHVPRYVAARFFGMSVIGTQVPEAGARGSALQLPPIARQANSTSDASPSQLRRSVTEPAEPSSPSRKSTILRPASKRSSGSCLEKPPLEVEAVTHASAPCGALLKWMLELVWEYIERERIEHELADINCSLDILQRRCAKLECDAAELEAARTTVQRNLEQLRLENAAVEKPIPEIPKSIPKPEKSKKEKPKEIELELSGSMAHLEREVAQLKVHFSNGATTVCNGDAEQALSLPRLADMVKAQKGSKFLLEGHCEPGEKEGVDYDRSLAVFEWLVEAALCPPGSLRMKGCKAASGEGRCVVPVLIDELIVRSGPISPELEAAAIKAKPGLFFAASSKELSGETRDILGKVASWLLMEDDTYVRVEGHADADEKAALAAQRAQAVINCLKGLGVAAKQMRMNACGSRHPASRLHSELNRRVELHAD